MVVEAQIRPVFLRPGPFNQSTKVFRSQLTASNSAPTFDVQPPKGEKWEILLANIIITAHNGGAGTAAMSINLRDDAGNNRMIAGSAPNTIYLSLSISGTDAAILQDDRFLRFILSSSAATLTMTADIVVSVRVL